MPATKERSILTINAASEQFHNPQMPEFASILAISLGTFGVLLSAITTWVRAFAKKKVTLELKADGHKLTLNIESMSESEIKYILEKFRDSNKSNPNSNVIESGNGEPLSKQ